MSRSMDCLRVTSAHSLAEERTSLTSMNRFVKATFNLQQGKRNNSATYLTISRLMAKSRMQYLHTITVIVLVSSWCLLGDRDKILKILYRFADLIFLSLCKIACPPTKPNLSQ